MANVFLSVPVPVGTGVGAPVDVTALGREKTFVLDGIKAGSISIEISADGGNKWASEVSLQTDTKTVREFAATHVRAVSTGVRGAVSLGIASDNIGTQAVTLPVPAGSGIGASVDVSALGTFNTVIVDGPFSGAINIDGSDDGVNWATCMTFIGPAKRSKAFSAQFLRVVRSGASPVVPSLPDIAVAAINDATAAVDTDELVKVSAVDTTTDYLDQKVISGDGVSVATVDTGGGDLALQLDATGLDAGNIDTGVPITVRGSNNAEGASVEIARADHEHRLEYEVEDDGVFVAARPRMNFIGDGVGAVDSLGGDKIDVTIPGPNLGNGGAVVSREQYLGDTVQTNSLAYVDAMSGTSVAIPVDGDYEAWFEGEGFNQAASGAIEIGISVDSLVVVQAESERASQGPAADMRPVLTSVKLTGLTAGQLVRALFRKFSGAGTVALTRRRLVIWKVQ